MFLIQRIKFKCLNSRKFEQCNLLMLQKRCLVEKVSNPNEDDSGYQAVPHYKQNSALFIAQPEKSPFPKIISPDNHFEQTFRPKNMLKSCLNVNLTARYGKLDLDKLKTDYIQMKQIEDKMETLAKEIKLITTKMTNLVKERGGIANKKATMQSKEAKDLIKSASEIKSEINRLEKELIPLKEIVTCACLRLPNSLHFSTLFIHNHRQNRDSSATSSTSMFSFMPDTEDGSKLVLFDFNTESLEFVRKKVLFLKSELHWKHLLNDSIVIDSKLITPKYASKLKENWSFVEQSSTDFNNRYMTGAYAKLEQALVDYIHDKLHTLTGFEHIKSVSMFKSAVVEGCGQSFYEPSNVFNIVRFGHANNNSDKKNPNSNIELLHLTGSSSLQALVLNFVRTQINSKYLPWTVFTNGKTYTPKKGQRNTSDILVQCDAKSKYLFENDAPDSCLTEENLNSIMNYGRFYLNEIKSQLTSFLNDLKTEAMDFSDHLGHENKNIDEIFIDLCKLCTYIYKDFHLPIRLVCLDANELKQVESFKIEVQAFLPSQNNYLTVGKIVLLNDYISKRLQIRTTPYDRHKNKSSNSEIKHTQMIYARLMNINAFMQVLIESNLVTIDKSTNKIKLPLLEKTSTNNIYFVLPDALKTYYV